MKKKKDLKKVEKDARNFKAYNVRYSENECQIIKEKALKSGITETEWIRFSSIERKPFGVKNVPKINQEAWLETGKLIATINNNLCKSQLVGEGNFQEILKQFRQEIMVFRNELLNGK